MSKWYYEKGAKADVVVSTRVRLARNLADLPFEMRLSDEGKEELLRRVSDAAPEELRLRKMADLTPAARAALCEKRLVSKALCGNPHGAVLLSDREEIAVMIGEEDHVRIQSYAPGYDLEGAYRAAAACDAALAEKLPFAYDGEWGYLTHCITNLGTGMRASVMLHLPGLCEAGIIGAVVGEVGKYGITARGSFGEGSDAAGHLFQFSNQNTLGKTEAAFLEQFDEIVKQIIEKERDCRKKWRERDPAAFDDRVFRALGTLRYARRMSGAEFTRLASVLRLGVSLGIVTDITPETLNGLTMAATGAGSVTEQNPGAETPAARDEARAALLRTALGGMR